MRVVVDGNDGTGKSTLVGALRALGVDAQDRGAPTKMSDEDDAGPAPGEVYLLLDAPVEVSRARLLAAGKDLQERYHTVEDLTHYRARYHGVAQRLGARCRVVDSGGTPAETLRAALAALGELGVSPPA